MYDDLNLFIKVSEVGNYSKASALLGITQGTLTRRIQSLEAELGVSLVKRSSRVFELTASGQLIYENMVHSIKCLNTALTDFNHNKDIISGTLKVALPAAVSYTLINPILSQFSQLYPHVKLLVTYTSRPINLLSDDYNVALSTIFPLSQNSKVKLLTKLLFRLYASPEYINKYGIPKNLKDIHQHKLLGLMHLDGTVSKNTAVVNCKTGKEEVVAYEAMVYVNNILHGLELAIAGDFIMGCWQELVTDHLARGQLQPILTDYTFGEVPCYLIRHSHSPSKLESIFAEFFINYFKNNS